GGRLRPGRDRRHGQSPRHRYRPRANSARVYLVGADGAHSTVRERLGIPFDGRGVFSNSITIYFEADLRPQMLGKPISVIYINNPEFGGFFRLDRRCQSGFLAVNTIGDPKTNPDAANAARDVS